MKFTSIASGSTGNCIYVSTENTNIIIDAGISRKRITEGLNQNKTDLSEVNAILITHEHSDHISSLSTIQKKYNIPMYATRETIQEIKNKKKFEENAVFIEIKPDCLFEINEVKIRPFSISHDASNPVAFRLECKNKSLAVCTDLGKYDEYIIQNLKGLDAFLIEANHDVKMLQVGSYPYFLKQRILSDKGHLSNENCGKLISELLHDGLNRIVLGHLSKENNYSQLAFQTVVNEINSSNSNYKAKDFDINIAKCEVCLDSFEV